MRSHVSELFLASSVSQMELSERQINACLDQLTEDQIWSRGADHENSIANLLLHLEGNLRQWCLHGIAGEADVRVRDAEFTLVRSAEVAAIRTQLADTVLECRRVIGSLPEDRLLEVIDPQPGRGPATILQAILRIVGHLQMHTGQIILLTKQMSGRDLDLSIPRRR